MILAVYRHGGQGSAISRAKGDVFSLRGLRVKPAMTVKI